MNVTALLTITALNNMQVLEGRMSLTLNAGHLKIKIHIIQKNNTFVGCVHKNIKNIWDFTKCANKILGFH
jgi:hypothetical protein